MPSQGGQARLNHPIQAVWRTLGEQVYKFLDSLEVKWSTIDPVRFAEEEGEAGPLYLWVGVEPTKSSRVPRLRPSAARGSSPTLSSPTSRSPSGSLSSPCRVACSCSTTSPTISILDPTTDLRNPFTVVQIAPRATPHFEGTGALYLCEGGQSNWVFLLTARHVPLPPRAHRNELYVCKRASQRRHEVLILGSKTYTGTLEATMDRIEREIIFVDYHRGELAALGEAVEGEHDGS